MYAAIGTIGSSTLGKFALNVVSTATAYILIPIAYQYATTDLNKGLVIAIVAAWALALIRMWTEVISLTAQAIANFPVEAVSLDLNLNAPDFEEGAFPAI